MVGCRACQRHNDNARRREPHRPFRLRYLPPLEEMARSAHHMEREEMFNARTARRVRPESTFR
jgi:hypothetical protein